jgi:hypothetical protein
MYMQCSYPSSDGAQVEEEQTATVSLLTDREPKVNDKKTRQWAGHMHT